MSTVARPTTPSDPVAELHAAVRKWTEHIPQNLPYVDLMFAFGYATLGDRARALALVEDVRRAMEVPVPSSWQDQKHFEAVVSAVTQNFLYKAFRYRSEQALAGQPHTGPLSNALLAELEDICATGMSGGTNNPYLRAEFVIDRFRASSRILEPQERIDQYRHWSKNQDTLQKELADLPSVMEPGKLTDTIRELYQEGVQGKATPEVQILVLHAALPLAPRVGETFTVELLQLVPSALAGTWTAGTPEPPDLSHKQGELLERGLLLASYYGRRELVKKLVDEFTEVLRSKGEGTRFQLVNAVVGQCLRSLKQLGMRNEIDRLLITLRDDILGGATLAELRERHAANPESWVSVLQTLLNLAAGWLTLGFRDRAAPILDAARRELLDPNAVRFPPKEYTALAQTYVFALGQGPSDTGFARLTELFRLMDDKKITNTWTTAQNYSRFHLNLVESAVFAFATPPTDPAHVVSG